MRCTKIQATLGPASSDEDTILRMVEAGMDGCRINMSHGSHDSARRLIATVRRVSRETGRPIAIGADLRGPKLRIGDVAGGSVSLQEGSVFHLTPEDRLSDAQVASVDYPHLLEDVRPGDPVLLNDGALRLRVEGVRRDRVVCRVEKGGELTSRKGVNLPGITLRVPSLTQKDLEDMAFAVEAGVDFLFLSYARSGEHVRAARAALSRLGAPLPLVAKIERQEGADALAEIVEAADGVCIARGDLGIETPLGAVPDIQSEAAELCRKAGKFAMMGGQVLASMVSSPTPLRAEVTDLVVIVRDGLDAVVLSDETAAGSYPVEAVRVAAEVLSWAEGNGRRPPHERGPWAGIGVPEMAGVLVSRNARAAELLAASRRFSPLVVGVGSPRLANWLSTWWGVIPVVVDDRSDPRDAARRALELAKTSDPSLPSRRLLFFHDARQD